MWFYIKHKVCFTGDMNRIREYRHRANLTQRELAEEIGSQRQSIVSNYESYIRRPNIDMCRAIVRALNRHGVSCTLDDVFPDDQAA